MAVATVGERKKERERERHGERQRKKKDRERERESSKCCSPIQNEAKPQRLEFFKMPFLFGAFFEPGNDKKNI